jgi:hypothetical protein
VTTIPESGSGAGIVVTGVVTVPVILLPKQAPLLHVCPLPQTYPHHPQLLVSTCVFRQTPLQKVCPEVQDVPAAGIPVVRVVAGIVMVPAVQMPLLQYWELLHTLPQRPQLLASTSVFRHAPPQVVWPSAHAPPTGVSTSGGSVVSPPAAADDEAVVALDFIG